MALTLTPNSDSFNVDGVPPGTKAVEFNSTAMWDNVNTYLSTNSDNMGLRHTQDAIAKSFVHGLGIADDPRSLEVLFPEVQSAKEVAKGMGPVLDDGLGQYNVSSAGIAAAQQAQNADKGPVA